MAAEDVPDIVIALRKEGQRVVALKTLAALCAIIGEFPKGTSMSPEEIAFATREELGVPTLLPYTPPPTIEEMSQVELLVYVRNALPEVPEGIAATLRAPKVDPRVRADVEAQCALLDQLIANWHAIARSQPYFPDLIVWVSRRALCDPQWAFDLDNAGARKLLREARSAHLLRISELLGDGFTVDVIAIDRGITSSAVRQILKRHGVLISRSPGAIRPSPSITGDLATFLREESQRRGVTPKRLFEDVAEKMFDRWKADQTG
jgi:hypothetical protein